MLTALCFTLISLGLFLLVLPHCRGRIYRPAALAIRHRAPKPITQTEAAVQRIASVLEPHIDMDPINRSQLSETLQSLDHTETPETWQARTLARALLFAVMLLPLILVSPFFCVAGMGLMGVAIYRQQHSQLTAEMRTRRQSIERELPQFAGTIRQSLNGTHDVVAILTTYQKICGPALRDEITRTLNDMITGNPERAIKAMEGRVASAKLGQVTRGLIAVLRGDDQRIYFDMLAAEFRKSQNEEVEKELLKRPDKMNPYMVMLFVCVCLMIGASLGKYIAQQMGAFF